MTVRSNKHVVSPFPCTVILMTYISQTTQRWHGGGSHLVTLNDLVAVEGESTSWLMKASTTVQYDLLDVDDPGH